MKLAHFAIDGGPGFGVIDGDAAIDISAHPSVAGTSGVADAYVTLGPGGFARLVAESPRTPLAQVRFRSLAARGSRLWCIGFNYREHAAEAAADIPPHPSVFLRTLESVVGHQEPVIAPSNSAEFDYEGEVAVVIGKPGRHIRQENAPEHILGYSCFAENSARDWQKHSRQVTAGKNFDRSGAIGPWCTTVDEFEPGAAIGLETFVNGARVQQASTDDLVYSIPLLISYISSFSALLPGDTIATGTPSGVGSRRKPPVFLRPGDEIEIRVQGVGALINTVAAEARP
jgi:2-keto-4-pentenoate hydratase/2-oxohepta-3-ene-1,7-dioic acid hydratase in catechol pathway